jgi:hypothetical protein
MAAFVECGRSGCSVGNDLRVISRLQTGFFSPLVTLALDARVHSSGSTRGPAVQAFVKIVPVRVVALDQRDLPVAYPVWADSPMATIGAAPWS